MKKIIICLVIGISTVFGQFQFNDINSMPGSFARMGFGARGMGMGNAMLAVTTGSLVAYYNPAISVIQEGNSFQTSYSFLSLDRSLNFLSFTRKFDFYSKKDPEKTKPTSTAGVSAGIINKGVSDIQLRDNEGNVTGSFNETEDQFFVGVANRFSQKIAVGILVKYYYNKIYNDVSASALGLDIGVTYFASDNFTIAAAIADINAKYKWDTSNIYGQDGNSTTDKFPLLKKIGVSYRIDNPSIIAALELESSNAGTNYLRIGAEYNIFEGLFLRSGVDRLNLSNADTPPRPAFGFSYIHEIGGVMAGIDYAFVIEPYSPADQHIVGINVNF